MHIALDFDNVLANTTALMLEKLHEHFPEIKNRIEVNHITQYDCSVIINKQKKLKPEQHWALWLACWEDYKNLQQLDPAQGYYLNQMLYRDEWEITIYSAAGKEIIKEWLEHYRLPAKDLKIKYVKPGASKLDIMKEFDILVDDNIQHIDTFISNEQDAIIYDRPWNRQYMLNHIVPRAKNMGDVYIIANRIKDLKDGKKKIDTSSSIRL